LPLEGPGRQHNAHVRLAAAVDELRRSRGRSVILRGHDFRLLHAPAQPMTPVATFTPRTIRRSTCPPKRAAGV
jgi:hypothetical protein